jgi:hypothetical protein
MGSLPFKKKSIILLGGELGLKTRHGAQDSLEIYCKHVS